MKNWHSVFVGLAALGVALACGGGAPKTPAPLPAPEAPAPKPAPEPEPSPTPPPPAAPPEIPAACTEVAMVEHDMEERMVAACSYREFDQMCALDPSGCWAKKEGCSDACARSHCDCDANCRTGCTTCAKRCGTDTKCTEVCVEEIGECYEGCAVARDACIETCEAAEQPCYLEFEDKRNSQCEACEPFARCRMQHFAKPPKFCQQQHNLSDFCARACEPEQ